MKTSAKQLDTDKITEAGTLSRLERAQEAHRILIRQGLQDRTEMMSHRDRLFVEQTTEHSRKLGDKLVLTPWQSIWLRSLSERYR